MHYANTFHVLILAPFIIAWNWNIIRECVVGVGHERIAVNGEDRERPASLSAIISPLPLLHSMCPLVCSFVRSFGRSIHSIWLFDSYFSYRN